jgi:diguanylate cyclase (GGDEF)-like protein/PAS domain S-box-containing protein
MGMSAGGASGVGVAEQEALLKYEAILNNASVGIAFTRDRKFQHVNPALEDMFGWPAGSLAGQPGMVVWESADAYQAFGSAVGPLLAQGRSIDIETRMKHYDGTLFWCRVQAKPIDPGNPATGGTIWIIEDETERRQAVDRLHQLNEKLEQRVRERTDELAAANTKLKEEIEERLQAEERARHLSLHDALTGLPNRRLLQDRLVQSLAQARREGWSVAVVFVDLDRFKSVNDSVGHAAGDEVLREMARRLKTALRDSDTVSRIGGDEFVVVLPHVQTQVDVPPVANKLLQDLSLPMTVGGRELRVTPSIGISVYPDDGEDALKLLSHADAAMYHAKEMGRRNIQFYAATMSEQVQTRLRLESDLHRAAERGELVMYLQPRIDLMRRTICGAESLIRWRHPQDGLLMPATFIPIAEESGQIVALGDWALNAACAQVVRWRESGLPALPISVNLSARQFLDAELPRRVADALTRHGIAPSLIELEITETTLMENTEDTMNRFADLRRLGVRIAIDDFGTGFSSLAYLKRFSVDCLKIDHSFVRDIGSDPDDAAIVRAIVNLAQSLQLRVTAEGVETRDQLFFLAACGCQEVQGYLFGKPMPEEELAALLKQGLSWPT